MKNILLTASCALVIFSACKKDDPPADTRSYPETYIFSNAGNYSTVRLFTKNAEITGVSHHTIDSLNANFGPDVSEEVTDLNGGKISLINDHQAVFDDKDTAEYTVNGEYLTFGGLITVKRTTDQLITNRYWAYLSSDNGSLRIAYNGFLEQGQTLQMAVQDSMVLGDTLAAKSYDYFYNKK